MLQSDLENSEALSVLCCFLWVSFDWFCSLADGPHICQSNDHFPPIKALFELVTSVTLTIFQQGRRCWEQPAAEGKGNHVVLTFSVTVSSCLHVSVFLIPARTETEFRNGHEMVLVFWNAVVAFDPVDLLEMFSPWISHTLRYRVFSH